MQRIGFAFLLLFVGAACVAQTPKPATTAAPSARDGFPVGHTTPEGAACDLARAFINRDAALFKSTCLPPFGGGENRKAYEGFLQQMTRTIAAEKKAASPSPYGPKTIDTVYAARHLSKSGPASYGYAVFDFKDVQFVDVAVTLRNGSRGMNRTLVVQSADGRWYVHPFPQSALLLSAGLNQESASTKSVARKP